MAFCYHFKLRMPLKYKAEKKVLKFKLVVPFKSRKLSFGRFGYSSLGEETKFIAKCLKLLRVHRKTSNYDTL